MSPTTSATSSSAAVPAPTPSEATPAPDPARLWLDQFKALTADEKALAARWRALTTSMPDETDALRRVLREVSLDPAKLDDLAALRAAERIVARAKSAADYSFAELVSFYRRVVTRIDGDKPGRVYTGSFAGGILYVQLTGPVVRPSSPLSPAPSNVAVLGLVGALPDGDPARGLVPENHLFRDEQGRPCLVLGAAVDTSNGRMTARDFYLTDGDTGVLSLTQRWRHDQVTAERKYREETERADAERRQREEALKEPADARAWARSLAHKVAYLESRLGVSGDQAPAEPFQQS